LIMFIMIEIVIYFFNNIFLFRISKIII